MDPTCPHAPPQPAVHCHRRYHLRHFRHRRSHCRCGRDLRCGQRHWTQGPPIPTKRGWLGAARIGRRIYVAGGKTLRTSAEKKAYGHDYHFTSRDNLEMLDLVGSGTHARRTVRRLGRHRLPRPDMGHRRQHHAPRRPAHSRSRRSVRCRHQYLGTSFAGQVFDSERPGEVAQQVVPGNATFRLDGDHQFLQQVEVQPQVITPNGTASTTGRRLHTPC